MGILKEAALLECVTMVKDVEMEMSACLGHESYQTFVCFLLVLSLYMSYIWRGETLIHLGKNLLHTV